MRSSIPQKLVRKSPPQTEGFFFRHSTLSGASQQRRGRCIYGSRYEGDVRSAAVADAIGGGADGGTLARGVGNYPMRAGEAESDDGANRGNIGTGCAAAIRIMREQ